MAKPPILALLSFPSKTLENVHTGKLWRMKKSMKGRFRQIIFDWYTAGKQQENLLQNSIFNTITAVYYLFWFQKDDPITTPKPPPPSAQKNL